MQKRNPFAVVVFSIITFGIYAIVWQVKTKNELNSRGATIPTAWLLIVPFVNIWWLWKYSEGVEKATNGNLSAVLSFILLFLLSIIGMAIVQSEYNKVGVTAEATPPTTPPSTNNMAPPPPPPPTNTAPQV
ncbi:MAG TPA: DUF4234 domain-containing protein [Patescibacteria group bacterium]|nr:DUF4234 domain-containing protein [Patescibacteria group bacterium]